MDNVPPTPPPSVPPGSPYPGQTYPNQPYPGQPFPGQPPQKKRFGCGCIAAGCLGLVALVVLFGVGIFFFVFGVIKSSDVYKTAVERAKTNPQVVEALGSPVEEGFILSGKINTTGDTGDANLNIPISGPKDKGTIHVVATKSGGVWHYSLMVVQVNGTDKVIDISEPSP